MRPSCAAHVHAVQPTSGEAGNDSAAGGFALIHFTVDLTLFRARLCTEREAVFR